MSGVPSFGISNLIAPAIVLLAVVFLVRAGRLPRLSRVQTSLLIFCLGFIRFILSAAVLFRNPFTARGWFDPFASGLEWVLLYEFARLVFKWLPRRTIIAVLIAGTVVSFVRVPIGSLIYFAYYTLTQGAGFDPQRLSDAFGSWLMRSYEHSAQYPYALFNLVDTWTLIGVSYFLRSDVGSKLQSKREFWQTGGFGSAGGLDMEMSSSKSHTTRLLCASAFLAGSSFREMVLNYLGDPNRAAAPELGLDLRLVAEVCQHARNRDHRYTWVFLACFVLAGIGALVDPTLGLAVLILAGAGVYFRKNWQEQFRFVRSFKKDVFDPEASKRQFSADLKPEGQLTLPADDQNLIVYQGFSPFVGAGMNLGGWSFVVNAEKGKEEAGVELEPAKFEISELYNAINHCIELLQFSGLTRQDMYFVNGTGIRDDKAILPDSHGHPVQKIEAERGTTYRNSNDRRIRHYQWICVRDWGNELCTSYFLRCTLRGHNLFVEINRYLLTPVADQYRKIDAMAEQGWKQGLGIAIVSLFVGPLIAAFSPLILLGRIQQSLEELFEKKEKERRKQVDENPLFNYGTGSSLRESLSSGQFTHYFQKLDGVFYSKVLEREILNSIVDFLDDHDIDTSELKERQSTILNSGIVVQGGDVKAESLAVGLGAQAVQVAKTESAPRPRIRRRGKEAA